MATPSLTATTDPALEAQVLWLRRRNEIIAAVLVVLLALAGFGGYRFYIEKRDSAAAASLASAKSPQDYEQLIAKYEGAPAGASAYLLLAQAQQKEKKFNDANVTLQKFIEKNPKHQMAPTAQMAIAVNLESMGKADEALAAYQRLAAQYPTSFTAPYALFAEVGLLKAKNQINEARHVCETIMTQYRESYVSAEAARALRVLQPPAAAMTPGAMPSNLPLRLLPPNPSQPAPSAPPKPKP